MAWVPPVKEATRLPLTEYLAIWSCTCLRCFNYLRNSTSNRQTEPNKWQASIGLLFLITDSMARRIASVHPMVESSASSAAAVVINFTVALKSTAQCEAKSARHPHR